MLDVLFGIKVFYAISFFFQAEGGIRDFHVTGVQTCALPIWRRPARRTPSLRAPQDPAALAKSMEPRACRIGPGSPESAPVAGIPAGSPESAALPVRPRPAPPTAAAPPQRCSTLPGRSVDSVPPRVSRSPFR